jgi:hypothetical protein
MRGERRRAMARYPTVSDEWLAVVNSGKFPVSRSNARLSCGKFPVGYRMFYYK